MSTYVPTAVALVDITLPADGENIDAADVNSPLQEVADGVAFVQGLAGNAAPLATIAALTALTTPADGTIRHVIGFGWYVFKASATTGLSPFRLAADDLTVGGWKSSTSHETALTKWVAASYITGVVGTAGAGATAEPPSTDPTSFVSTTTSAAFRAGLMKVGVASTHASNAFGYCLPLDAFLVDGCTLTTVTLRFRPATHGADPAQRPRLGVIRAPKAGPFTVVPTALLSTGGGLVQDSGGTYVSDRTLAFTPDQNNTIDLLTYTYTALVWDEHSTNAVLGNGYAGVDLAMTAIPDARR